MTQMDIEEMPQELQDLIKEIHLGEHSLIIPYDDPREFGRRLAVKLFEKHVKGLDGQESSTSETE